MADELVGGRYRLVVRLGVGGMSEVWAADDVELGRRVALKLLARDADPARFEREAQAVAALAHPNICRLYDYGEADGRPFMVLEYLGGGTLEDRLVPGEPHPLEETERIARELAAGLAHAHARGLVHRDLKPANVLFDDEGVAKIADFGIARLVGSGTLTETGTLLGTAAYISPEQAQGLPATAASDVYSFGVILYRMLAGRLPFESESPIELARMHIQERPFPLADARPAAPPALAALADASLAKDPQARPPDGGALVRALSSGEQAPTLSDAPTIVAGSEPEPTRVIPRGSRGDRDRRSVPLPLVLAALLLLGAGAAGVAIALLVGRSNDSTPAPSSAARRTRASGTATSAPSTTAPTASTSTAASTRRATTVPTTVAPPPTPPPTPPPPTPPPPPTTVPTTVTIPVTTPPPPTPPPPPPP
ncbi:MAG: serine/threonine protein kinase [Actinobacteria bacterium]|nr:MAG: serine/threonine protein kinase [Actinomycetota bacterium]